jgi:hypothetical protein
MDTDEGRPLARSEDKYRRVLRKLTSDIPN